MIIGAITLNLHQAIIRGCGENRSPFRFPAIQAFASRKFRIWKLRL